ncbi:hypothetical protein KUTeg_019208 [Tegillarca granosa]|uniref:Uncharacterized protein n=1 Tax=Tegillarca granosa TaxID=220873 RepID=A0ABQ9EBW2_TEGGR|nr:hypothetical protein KUTeg_019208 [Tegillarca granosa]
MEKIASNKAKINAYINSPCKQKLDIETILQQKHFKKDLSIKGLVVRIFGSRPLGLLVVLKI